MSRRHRYGTPWIYCHHCQRTTHRELYATNARTKTFCCQHCNGKITISRAQVRQVHDHEEPNPNPNPNPMEMH